MGGTRGGKKHRSQNTRGEKEGKGRGLGFHGTSIWGGWGGGDGNKFLRKKRGKRKTRRFDTENGGRRGAIWEMEDGREVLLSCLRKTGGVLPI